MFFLSLLWLCCLFFFLLSFVFYIAIYWILNTMLGRHWGYKGEYHPHLNGVHIFMGKCSYTINAEIKMRICAQSTLKAKQRWFNKGLLEEGNCDLTHKGQRILVHKQIHLLCKGFMKMDGPEAQRQITACWKEETTNINLKEKRIGPSWCGSVVECQPTNRRVASLIPSQGTCERQLPS